MCVCVWGGGAECGHLDGHEASLFARRGLELQQHVAVHGQQRPVDALGGRERRQMAAGTSSSVHLLLKRLQRRLERREKVLS